MYIYHEKTTHTVTLYPQALSWAIKNELGELVLFHDAAF